MADTQPTLIFHQGTLILKNYQFEIEPPYFVWDSRSRQWRTRAIYYDAILKWFQSQNLPLKDLASQIKKVPLKLRLKVVLRDYQKEAVNTWLQAGKQGSVCLPTGAGKSWVALKIMEEIGKSTLIVLPTIALMNQWYDLLCNSFGLEVGILGGGYHEVRDVTVTTYDSAYRHIDHYGDRFGLLIFDEVHHLPSQTYTHIAEMSLAPHRLGLTATYERPDGLHVKLERLIGPKVYEKTIKELEGEHLAEYETMKIAVELTPKEKVRYKENQVLYDNFVKDKKMRFYGGDLQEFLRMSAYDRRARRAFLARLQARHIIMGAERKLEVLETLLKLHRKDRVLIFTMSNELVYHISETFLVPAITHHTKTVERHQILDRFRKGIFKVLVTSRVLNEGVDIPEANVAIILSGTASPVEHLQRLGRILRKGANKQAILYELVTRGTKESQISYRRRKSEAYQ